MKRLIWLIIFSNIIAFHMFSCKGMYENIDEYMQEDIYPARFDTITGKIGFERVELDFFKKGRVSSKDIYMGKSKKTVVEYDNKRIVVDSIVSWINIKDLKLSKLYRFKAYTEDEYGNKSVPQEIALIPYTQSELSTIAVQSPRVLASPTTAVLDWTDNLSSILLDYTSLSFSYTDNQGVVRSGTRGLSPRIFAGNLAAGQKVNVDVKYKVVPKVNGVSILDTIELSQPVSFNVPDANSTFTPAEADILRRNGITTFSSAGLSAIRKLVFPVHTISLQDLFYFTNLDEVDLTGGNLFQMNTISYNRNAVVATLGGGDFSPFVRRVGNMPDVNAQFLVDLLENNLVGKVKYIPYSLGIDHLLAPFVESGKVELVQTPSESLIPLKFFVNGAVQATNWKHDMELDPGNYPAGIDLLNVVKIVPKDRASSFVIVIPTSYEFNVDVYKYLKFKVYAPDKTSFTGNYINYRKIWPRFMNYLWAFTAESSYGQQLWNTVANDYNIPEANLQKWVDMKVDLSQMKGKHNRVIVINIGGEPSTTLIPSWAPPKDIIYYFSNFRFSKD